MSIVHAPPLRLSRPPLSLHPPRVDLWPDTVKSAEMLRGTLVRCGPGVRLAAWPETPRVRAAALSRWLASGLVATHATSAWIWGALRMPEQVLEFSTRDGKRAGRPRDEGYRLSQLAFRRDDVHLFGDLRVASPARTLYDLLRRVAPHEARHRIACRVLLQCPGVDRDSILVRLSGGSKAHRRLALDRLAAL